MIFIDRVQKALRASHWKTPLLVMQLIAIFGFVGYIQSFAIVRKDKAIRIDCHYVPRFEISMNNIIGVHEA